MDLNLDLWRLGVDGLQMIAIIALWVFSQSKKTNERLIKLEARCVSLKEISKLSGEIEKIKGQLEGIDKSLHNLNETLRSK